MGWHPCPVSASTEIAAAVAANVRAERARRRMTQQELADASGLSRSAVSKLEEGRRGVGLDDAAALCRAFGVSLVVLLHGAPPDVLEALSLAGRL